MEIRIFIISFLILLSGCSEYLPIAGGKLNGKITPPPADWTDIAKADIVELETSPAAPYSVKLWIIGIGKALYVHAGATRTTWVENIDANPDVRLLIDNNLYDLRATRVEDASEFKAFSDVYEEKYGNRPRNENVNEAYLFRLEPRR